MFIPRSPDGHQMFLHLETPGAQANPHKSVQLHANQCNPSTSLVSDRVIATVLVADAAHPNRRGASACKTMLEVMT